MSRPLVPNSKPSPLVTHQTPISLDFPTSSRPLLKPKHRRSKVGCTTCRRRKLKCDETRPSCNRCKITGRACEGYPETDSDAAESRASTPSGRSPSPLQTKPSRIPTIGQDVVNIRLFDLFLTSAIPTISGHTTSRTWKTLLPQLAYSEPAIANAVLAISALYEETEIKRKPLQEISNERNMSAAQGYALDRYGRALQEVQRQMQSPSASRIAILASCIIFAAFESLRGRSQAAVAHIRSGHQILQGGIPSSSPKLSDPSSTTGSNGKLTTTMGKNEAALNDPPAGPPSTMPPSLSPEMGLVANSLGKLLILLGSAELQNCEPVPKYAATLPPEMPECPTEFSTVDEARATFAKLMNTAREIAFYCLEFERQGRVPGPDEGTTRCLLLNQLLCRWSAAYDRLLRRTPEEAQADPSVPASPSEIALFRSWCKFASVRMWTTVLPSQASLDTLTPDFEDLLDHCERCLNFQAMQHAARHGRKGHRAPVFLMDLGVLPMLFWVGRMEIDIRIRLRALELTNRTPRREALWDSEIVKAAIERSLAESKQHGHGSPRRS